MAQWGFYAHKKINRMACFTLPEEMFGFFKDNIEFISEHAVDPDKRRYSTKGEAPKHYIDIDHYAEDGENPFEVMPRSWIKAKEKFTEDTLLNYGTVPWHINFMVFKLTVAFQEGNTNSILRNATDLGHYVGDAHVPLHTTKNYNGQLTNQVGIHGFWESRIPELSAENYDFFVGSARYIDDVQDYIWLVIEESHWAVDSVLTMERNLTQRFDSDAKYSFENRGAQVIHVYSEEFSKAFEQELDGMIEKRMVKAVHTLGSLWYTAWVNAGQPDINSLSFYTQSESDQTEQIELNKKFSLGKIFGRDHDN